MRFVFTSRVLIALVLSFSPVTVAIGQEAPTGFSDLPWGARAPDVRQFLIERCEQLPVGFTDDAAYCLKYPIASVGQTRAFAHLQPGDHLAGYSLKFSYQQFPPMKALAIEKFGHPTTTTTTATGGERLTWLWGNVRAELVQHCGRIPDACLHVLTKPLFERFAEDAAKQRRQGLKDF